jgi:acetyl-CoA carboxylase carboxyltransferase component
VVECATRVNQLGVPLDMLICNAGIMAPPKLELVRGLEKQFVDEYREAFMNPYRAADVGQIDEVIEPHETRPRLVRALEVLRTKVQQNPPRKHGLMPV